MVTETLVKNDVLSEVKVATNGHSGNLVNPVRNRLSYLRSLLIFHRNTEGLQHSRELVESSVQFRGSDPQVQAVVTEMSPREMARLMLNWRGNTKSFRNTVCDSLNFKRRDLITKEKVEIIEISIKESD